MFYADDDEASADEERELYIENASAEKLYCGLSVPRFVIMFITPAIASEPYNVL